MQTISRLQMLRSPIRAEREFAHRVEDHIQQVSAAVKSPFQVNWEIGWDQHFDSPRGFGVTYFNSAIRPNQFNCLMRFAEKLVYAPVPRQEGIIRHELGHVLATLVREPALRRWAASRGVELPPAHQAEIYADAVAHAVWGQPLQYDDNTVQSTACCRTLRPKHLGW